MLIDVKVSQDVRTVAYSIHPFISVAGAQKVTDAHMRDIQRLVDEVRRTALNEAIHVAHSCASMITASEIEKQLKQRMP